MGCSLPLYSLWYLSSGCLFNSPLHAAASKRNVCVLAVAAFDDLAPTAADHIQRRCAGPQVNAEGAQKTCKLAHFAPRMHGSKNGRTRSKNSMTTDQHTPVMNSTRSSLWKLILCSQSVLESLPVFPCLAGPCHRSCLTLSALRLHR